MSVIIIVVLKTDLLCIGAKTWCNSIAESIYIEFIPLFNLLCINFMTRYSLNILSARISVMIHLLINYSGILANFVVPVT